jgi:RNA polymerase sigma factor (sigma-70 family)
MKTVNATATSAPVTDRQLLDRFLADGCPDAFAELVARHGRMVFGVCSRVLRNRANAEDALQATFLVLLRKAGTFRRGESLGGWLHTVAVRVSLRARKSQAARYLLEREAAMTAEATIPHPEPQWTADLDAALAGLPDEYRLPITLCYLQGRTGDEAAAELGCSRSTLTRRLTEGRDRLRQRLARLGVIVPAAALMFVLENAATAAEPPAAAVAAITSPGAAGVSPAAVALAEGVAAAGFGAGKLAVAAALIVAVAGLATWAFVRGPADRPPPALPIEVALGQKKNPKVDPLPLKPVAPAPIPLKLRDEQKISAWEWDKFKWQPVDGDLVRPVTFAVPVPPGHKFVTVAVDDANGVRVRNLLDAVEVSKLGGKPDATEPQSLTVEWNGLNDDGQPQLDGAYRVRGCSHKGMKLVYEYSFLNPGTPPWEHYPNSGWGGDHGYPHAIACLRNHGGGTWRVAIAGSVGEGGTASFAIDADDRKCKAFNNGWNGSKALAAADGMLWICESGSKYLYRVTYHESKQIGFKAKAGPTPNLKFDVDPWGIAVGRSRAAVLLHDEKQPRKERVVLFDKDSGDNRVEVPLAVPGRRNGLAFAADGATLLVSTGDGMLSLAAGEAKPTPQPVKFGDIRKPGPLATDKDGNLFVMDRGADYRVKVFSPDGKLLREIGTKGGQGERLDWDRAALHGVEAISVDDDGCLWAAEQGETDTTPGMGFVRRIAVWKADGAFLKDFVGTTWYAANNTCLHEQDPTLAYGYGVIYKLDPGAKPGYRPLRYVTVPQPADAPFWLWTGAPHTLFGSARLFRSDVSGTMREYLLQANGLPILFQADDKNGYRPILAIGSHEHNKAFPQVKDEPKALFLWTDLNGDAKPQPDEFQRLPGSTHKADLGMGYPPSRELLWYVEGIELKPAKFTPGGVPIYDVATAKRLPIPQHYLPVGDHLIAGLGGKFNSPRDGVYANGHHLFTDRNGRPVAKYRCNWGGVHASWSSTPGYAPGQTGRSIGELHFAGVVEANKDLGRVVAIQGNYGQSFLWSGDGLFVTPLFKDSRLNPKGWGAKEQVGADWTDVSMYGECFGGMMARQDDGKVRYLFGRNGCHVVRVEGLEAVKRFDAGTVELKGPTATGKPAPKPDSVDRILRVPNVKGRFPAFKADGEPAEWKDVPRREIKVGDDAVAKVAVAHTVDHLWILAEVEDPSPWKNAGTDPKLAFKTGDAIDLCLGPDRQDMKSPAEGDIRVLIAPGAKKLVVMAYRPVKARAKPDEAMKFESPVKARTFASVVPVQDAQVAFKTTRTGYVVEIRLPCDQIELRNARSGLRIRGDVGVLWGNEAGLMTERRTYLFNRGPAGGVVSDTPTEAELHPGEWGVWVFE